MIIDEQVGNASQEVPESDFNEADFFGQLDRGVNAGILESEQTTFQESDNTQNEESPVEKQTEDVETLKQRYADSSTEGKRLNQRLKELEPYLPVLDAMREDPDLIQHVRGYFEGGGQTPKNMVEKLDLGEDFIFDPDEAVSDPNSDSAKVLNSTIDGVVQRKLTNELAKQKQEHDAARETDAFRQKKQMSDAEWSDFVEFSKQHRLSLDDIYLLKNRGTREANIASNAGKQAVEQINAAQSKPKSFATTGSAKVDVSQEDKLFDAILGIDKQLDNAFG